MVKCGKTHVKIVEARLGSVHDAADLVLLSLNGPNNNEGGVVANDMLGNSASGSEEASNHVCLMRIWGRRLVSGRGSKGCVRRWQ
jgi:hypothetical protein